MFKQNLQELTILKNETLLANNLVRKERANRIIDFINDVGESNTLWWFEDKDKDYQDYPAMSLETFMVGLKGAFTHLSNNIYAGNKKHLYITIECMYAKALLDYKENNNNDNELNLVRLQILAFLILPSNMNLCMTLAHTA